jgi:hypothetical protein
MAGKIERQDCGSDEDLTCTRCGGFVLCESWCESVNTNVRYARDVVLQASHLSFGDRIILHALGVRWTHGRERRKLGSAE